MNCPICNKELPDYKRLGYIYTKHVKHEHPEYSKEDFYFKFLRNSKTDGICPICGKRTNLTKNGFKKYCCKKCYFKDQKNHKESYKKRVRTLKEEYGSLENYYISRKKNLLNKYGDENYNNRDKWKKTLITKNGSDFMKPIHKKAKETFIKKYGVDFPLLSDAIQKTTKETRQRNLFKKYKNEIDSDLYNLLSYHNSIFEIECKKCGEISEFSHSNIKYRKIHKIPLCLNCQPKIPSISSSLEKELLHFISEIYDGEVVSGFREYGKELDIYIPKMNFGIEFNGLYYHSDAFVHDNYHTEKTKLFKEKGIDIIHIFEDEWLYQRDIIENIIKVRLKLIKNKIFARNCIIDKITTEQEKNFLNENHIQKYIPSKIKYGLFFNNELVSVITFSKSRFKNKKYDYELLRFCNKINTNVVGGFSKLLSYFLKQFSNVSIITYCDLRLFDGSVYGKNGFLYKKTTQPNYYWTKNNDRYNRFKFRKSELLKMYPEKYNMTESEIMYGLGYRKIFNCGNDVYVYKK